MRLLKGTRVTWLGHATVLVQLLNGINLLIDPFIEQNPKYPKGFVLPEKIDCVLLTHGHVDHIADAAPIAKKYGATVVAMVEPEIAENTVPATTATTASLPGTCRIRRSTPSITFTARPVWNSTSPIRMKSGIGVSEKLATEPTLLRASWTRPASPPRNSHAPSRLMTRNENATGRPRNSRTVDPPSISHAAASHDMA